METYYGHVRTPADAIVLFEACRLGLLPRVQRRLSEKERQSIKSGSVFVWDEREAGMRRWTDGKSWSASRVSGSFLTYREMEGKRGGNGFAPPLAPPRAGKTPDSTRGSDSDLEPLNDDGPDGYRYKPDGLMKQSFSITTSSGNHLHLISYYTRSHPNAQSLKQPSTDPALRHIQPQKGMYPESTVHDHQHIPAITRSPMVNGPLAHVPQMAGYARGPSGQPLGFQPPNMSWNPPLAPPVMHHSQNGYGYYHPPNNLPPAPPPSGFNGPLPMASMAPMSSRNPYSSSPALSYAQSPVSTPYTRNATPPLDPSISRPNHPSHHRSTSSGSSLPQYLSTGSPRLNSSIPMSPPQPPPQSQPGSPSSTPPLSKIDPRLMAPSPLSQSQSIQSVQSPPPLEQRSSSPSEPKQENCGTPTPREYGAVQASTIPSIGALMNDSTHESAESDRERVPRSNSRSPGGTVKEGPQDIPSEKLGFREDMRALRVLDRAFKT